MEPGAHWFVESLTPADVTVFNPDGTSYSIVPADIQFAMLEPALLVAGDETLPDQLTVFEPSGLSYSYEFTPVDVTLEPIELVMGDDLTLALSEDEAMSRPTYVAHFVSPPTYTGILEAGIS